MHFLFLGTEERFKADISEKEDITRSSFSFSATLPEKEKLHKYRAVIIPAIDFLQTEIDDSCFQMLPVFASGKQSTIRECFEYGCSDYLRVPWQEDELLCRLQLQNKKYPSQNDNFPWANNLVFCLDPLFAGADSYRLAAFFSKNRGVAFSRQELALALNLKNANGRKLDMRISRLRLALRASGCFSAANSIKCVSGAYIYE